MKVIMNEREALHVLRNLAGRLSETGSISVFESELFDSAINELESFVNEKHSEYHSEYHSYPPCDCED